MDGAGYARGGRAPPPQKKTIPPSRTGGKVIRFFHEVFQKTFKVISSAPKVIYAGHKDCPPCQFCPIVCLVHDRLTFYRYVAPDGAWHEQN